VHAALRQLRAEPLRDAVAALFATATAQAAFLAPSESVARADPSGSAVMAPADLSDAIARLADVARVETDVEALTLGSARDIAAARAIRPRLLAQSVTAALLFEPVVRLACGADVERAVAAYDEWGAGAAIGELARQAGATDAQAWRVVELARALVAIGPGSLAAVPSNELPTSWFEATAVRTAAGWNRWQDETYLSREAWTELVEALAARDGVLGIEGAAAAANELKRRAAAAGYRLAADAEADDQPDGRSPA